MLGSLVFLHDGFVAADPLIWRTTTIPDLPISMVKNVESKDEFDKIMAELGSKLLVIDFFATWCGPCKMIAPQYEKIAEEFGEKAVFIKVDVDEVEELVEEYKVAVMPTFVMLKLNPGVGIEQQEFIEGSKIDQVRDAVVKYTTQS